MKTVLFHRRFKKFQGGHLKAYHYFTHVLSSPDWDAKVRFTENSVWDESNPWRAHPKNVLAADERCRPDILFLGGRDWERIPSEWVETPPAPVVNLIQHVRHGFENDPRRPHLRHYATRICCSQQVADSIREAGANGPIHVNEYGLDPSEFPKPLPVDAKDIDVLIVAIKDPALGRRLRRRLWWPGRRIQLLQEPALRSTFIGLMNRARVTLHIPHRTEGFYIPALEGMALDSVTVCPDCIGNRDFCLPDQNAFRPAYDFNAIRAATEEALSLSEAEASPLLASARETFARHDLARERSRFLEILDETGPRS